MGHGVNFTESSAKRIARAVAKVEGIPTPTNTQRPRGGGLGRMSLWEVTAVTTLTKTVNIKRLQKQDGELNDVSTRQGVLFDIKNQPSTGDRGLLVRLGDGSLFFFNPQRFDRIFFDAVCFVDSEDPTEKFGFPDKTITRLDITGNKRKIGVCHFETRLDDSVQVANNKIVLQLPEFTDGGKGIESSHPETGTQVKVFFLIRGILDDFDPSTLTFNDYSSLTKETAGRQGVIHFRANAFTANAVGSDSFSTIHSAILHSQDLSLVSGNMRTLFSNRVFGVSFEMLYSVGGRPGAFTQMDLTLRDLGGTKRFGWIEFFRT